MELRFSETALKGLTFEGKQKDYRDTEIGQLSIRVGTNSKTFSLNFSLDGKRRKLKLGRHPELTVVNARKMALKHLSDMAHGHDPHVRSDGVPTFHEIWGEYNKFIDRKDRATLKAGRKPTAKKSRHDAALMYRKYIYPEFGNRKITDIKRRDISRLVERMADRVPTLANRTLSLTRVIYRRAVNMGYLEHNPCYEMEKPALEFPRTRILSDEEIKLLWSLLAAFPQHRQDAVKLLFLTCARHMEVLKMKWADLDFEQGLWNLSDNKTDMPSVDTICSNRPD